MNEAFVIWIETRPGGCARSFRKQGADWVQRVESSGREYRMSAEQVLSHLLPALAGDGAYPHNVRVERRNA